MPNKRFKKGKTKNIKKAKLDTNTPSISFEDLGFEIFILN
jgi:hypothetical protein